MAQFTVASLLCAGEYDMSGQSVSPSVGGPDGSSGPGSATNVTLKYFSIGLGSQPQGGDVCYVCDHEVDGDSDLANAAVAVSEASQPGFGLQDSSDGYSLRFPFNVLLQANRTYYFYFTPRWVRCNMGSGGCSGNAPYPGGDGYDASGSQVAATLQFVAGFDT